MVMVVEEERLLATRQAAMQMIVNSDSIEEPHWRTDLDRPKQKGKDLPRHS